jgi:hypothetical protein
MTTEEQWLTELLNRATPEPPVELSANRVTVPHVDKSRSSWLMPALAAAAVVVVAGAGVGFGAAHRGSSAISPSASAGPGAAPAAASASPSASAVGGMGAAPASFDPLVLPVNVGWLPAGFTENQPSPDGFPTSRGPLEVTATQVSLGASASDGRGLALTVAARGVALTPWSLGNGETAVVGMGAAPDVNGHPAKWIAGGLEWEYAKGGWAALITGGNSSQQAKAGWGRYCTLDVPKGTGATPVADPKQTCAPYAQPSAQIRALLEKVAGSLTWTPQRFTFPYKFTGPLPAGWTVGDVSGNFVNGRLTAGEMHIDPPGATGARSSGDTLGTLDIQAYADSSSHSYCPAMPEAHFITYNGVKWQVGSDKGSHPDYLSWATACSGTPVDAHGGSVGLGFDSMTAQDNQVGMTGIQAILPLMKFFAANPADWTTHPLAS